jgi:hypothetical protein
VAGVVERRIMERLFTKNLVSIAAARTMKYRGYNEPTQYFYNGDKICLRTKQTDIDAVNGHYEEYIPMPFIIDAMMWIEHKYDACISILSKHTYKPDGSLWFTLHDGHVHYSRGRYGDDGSTKLIGFGYSELDELLKLGIDVALGIKEVVKGLS